MYDRYRAVEEFFTFGAVVQWMDDVDDKRETLNATVDTTLKGPDLQVIYTPSYSDGM